MNRDKRDARDAPWSRRDVFRAAAGIAAAPLVLRDAEAAQRPPVAEDAGTLERLWRQGPSTTQPILLKGGTIVSMDAKVGDFANGDLLIRGKKIVSVGASGQAQAPPHAQVLSPWTPHASCGTSHGTRPPNSFRNSALV